MASPSRRTIADHQQQQQQQLQQQYSHNNPSPRRRPRTPTQNTTTAASTSSRPLLGLRSRSSCLSWILTALVGTFLGTSVLTFRRHRSLMDLRFRYAGNSNNNNGQAIAHPGWHLPPPPIRGHLRHNNNNNASSHSSSDGGSSGRRIPARSPSAGVVPSSFVASFPRVAHFRSPDDPNFHLSKATHHLLKSKGHARRAKFSRTIRPLDERPCPYCEIEPYATRRNETAFFYRDCEPVVPALESETENDSDDDTDNSPTRRRLDYPTCNLLHEMPVNTYDRPEDDTYALHFLSDDGTFRSARILYDPNDPHSFDDHRGHMVYKTLYADGQFVHETLDMHRLDVAVMEAAASANPNFVRARAYCGQATVTEFADEYKYQVVRNDRLGYVGRLEASLQAIQSLDALHYLGSEDRELPSFAHLDVKASNFMLSRLQGMGLHVAVNDFNLGLVLRRHRKTGKLCHYPMLNRYGGAPELTVDQGQGVPIDMIAFDIFRFGHVLHNTAINRISLDANQGRVLGPEIIDQRMFDNQPWSRSALIYDYERLAQLALFYGTIGCLYENPKDRLTAPELIAALQQSLLLVYRVAQEGPPGTNQTRVGISAQSIQTLFEPRKRIPATLLARE